MKIVTYVFALVLLDGFMTWVNGADDFTVGVSQSCHNDNDNVQMIVHYTGTGNPTTIKWKFSKMINELATLDIVISFCAPSAGADDAFPEDRMSFICDTTNNQYNITINNFNETADAGIWQAAVSVSGSITNFQSVTVSKCSSTTVEEKSQCEAGCIAGVTVGCCCACLAGAGVGRYIYKKKKKGNKPGRYDPTNNSHGDKP